jgi:YVTN family beta-propeller protein
MLRRSLTVSLALAAVVPATATGAAPVTPAGWRVDPAGIEIPVSQGVAGFQGPMGAALSPDGNWLLGASSGAARYESADLFDLAGHQRSSYVGYDATKGEAAFYGAAWAPDGQTAYVSGGGQNVVHVLHRDGGTLTEAGAIAAPAFPAGLALGRTPRGERLYVANNLSAVGAGNPPGHQVTVIDPATRQVESTIDLGAALEPLGVALDRTGDKAYVTNWMGRSVSVVDTAAEAKVGDIVLSPATNPDQADHPSAVAANPVRDEVYTANANSDTVSVIDTTTDRLAATIAVALVPGGPKGSNPVGLGISPDGHALYVALAGENAIAVVDLDRREVTGFIPTAWYPSAVSVTPDGKRLVVTNANASGAGPNPCGGLTPLTTCGGVDRDTQYSGSMIKGSVQIVAVPGPGRLRALTNEVVHNNQARARTRPKPRGAQRIRHVIYVIRENRTYDQVFGDLPKGNGDARLDLFKDDSAPNARALAQRFALFDNFYADAEVSADGHNWSTQANATDYVDKTWPINYSPSPRGGQRGYDLEDVPFAQQFPSEPLRGDASIPRSAAAQTGGYLWDDAYFHGVSFRDYGEYTPIPGECDGPGNASHTTHLDARFGDHVDVRYDGYNLACSDHASREPEWEREFREFERNGDLPELELVRLPNDHTRGTVAGAATPQSYVADNDLALGRIVDAVSHSRYWKSTAILVTEDDAQNGPDHVDAHRTLALVVSPYTQAGKVDSTHYDTASMVATIEDLVGMPPMSITDARASRMWGAFVDKPSLRPYEAIKPEVVPFGDPGAPINPANAPMARAAAKWDLKDADAAPEIALNESIWKSVKGRHAEMPRPRHERIIGSRPNDEDEGDEDG